MELPTGINLSTLGSQSFPRLASREIVLWISAGSTNWIAPEQLVALVRLPWQAVLVDEDSQELINLIDEKEPSLHPLVRRRGFIEIVRTNPLEVSLPKRCLPVFLLNPEGESHESFAYRARRMSMLDNLAKRDTRELWIVCGPQNKLPQELSEMWNTGFHPQITALTNPEETNQSIQDFHDATPQSRVNIVSILAEDTIAKFAKSFLDLYEPEQVLIRSRESNDSTRLTDISALINPENPIDRNFEFLPENLLLHVQPDELSAQELEGFFTGENPSWRSYAAGVPWERFPAATKRVLSILRSIQKKGVEENKITYISAEEGSGATTMARQIAWQAAFEGFPTLVAKDAAAFRDAFDLSAFLNAFVDAAQKGLNEGRDEIMEVPWLVVFEKQHWEGRENELRSYVGEITRSGRGLCALVIVGPYKPLPFFDTSTFEEIAVLTHEISSEDSIALGHHLSPFLDAIGKPRSRAEWKDFYERTSLNATSQRTMFWISLSFWLQRTFDLDETVQSWIYRQFKNASCDEDTRRAIIEIAALSSAGRMLPSGLLPRATDFPVSEKLEDIRKDIPSLGLAPFRFEITKYWAFIHDLIGRFLITSLFYDRDMCERLGFLGAENPEHLRFQVLQSVAVKPQLGLKEHGRLAEDFAVNIFKIDPDHGHANFMHYWRELLDALDAMPSTLKKTSRTFLHHCSISRRRIAKANDYFPMDESERVDLLRRCVSDLEYCLEYTDSESSGESDRNILNSLAQAYFDLADALSLLGGSDQEVEQNRINGREATRKAFLSDPDNSYVVETYIRNLVIEARSSSEQRVSNSLEVLSLVYSSNLAQRAPDRLPKLSQYADEAFSLLLSVGGADERNTIGIQSSMLLEAISALARDIASVEGMELGDFPKANRLRAFDILNSDELVGNLQAAKLLYAISCIDFGFDFELQLEFLDRLEGGGAYSSPQFELERAILLHQCGRHFEAAKEFRRLRSLWRTTDFYVDVPDRLHWLLANDRRTRLQVSAVTISRGDFRQMARVREMQDIEVPFRAREFGSSGSNPGGRFRGVISFGHNGPFLRPITSSSKWGGN